MPPDAHAAPPPPDDHPARRIRHRRRVSVGRPEDVEAGWDRPPRVGSPPARLLRIALLAGGGLCLVLGTLAILMRSYPASAPEPGPVPPAMDAFRIELPPRVAPIEALDRRDAAIKTRREAKDLLDTFFSAPDPASLPQLLRPTPDLRSHLERYDGERLRLAGHSRDLATRLVAKGPFTGIPVRFTNQESRMAWFERTADGQLRLDLDSMLGCGDRSVADLIRATPVTPVRIRGIGRILPRGPGPPDDAPDLLALRDPRREHLVLLQLDSHSSVSPAILSRLRTSPRQSPILLDVARSPAPSPQSRLRVVKIHALHWLYVPGFTLESPQPTDS